MPTFFFDLRSPIGLDLAELGIEFSDVDTAYLDGCRAVIEMSAEMLRERQDPSALVFEVRNAVGALVMELPFREVLRPGERLHRPTRESELHRELRARVAHSRALRADLKASVCEARTTVEQSRRIVRRSTAA